MEVTRYLLVSLTILIGVLRFNNFTALIGAILAYLSAPFVAHPIDAWQFLHRRPNLRSYAASITSSNYGSSLDLGPNPDQIRRAISGDLKPFRVFVSSTFTDLAAERDLIAKQVFPRIASECETRGVVWAPIDLRWGITDMQRSAGRVVRVCLDSVERSRPHAIGIIGSRYGSHVSLTAEDRDILPTWVTEAEALSVTHLELRHASSMNPAALSVFVMKSEARSEADRAALASMIEELTVSGAQIVRDVADEYGLAQLVHADLMERLDREASQTALDNVLLGEISAHAAVERRLAEYPTSHSDVLEEVARHHAAGKTAILRGAPGSGRSTLLASWARAWRRNNPDDIVITRFVGLTAESQTWPQVLRSIIAEVSLRTGQPVMLPSRDEELAVSAAVRVLDLQKRQRIVIGIDGLDHFQSRHEMEHFTSTNLSWLPQKSERTRLEFIPTLVTTNLEEAPNYAYDAAMITIPELTIPDRKSLVEDSLVRVDRSLPDDAVRLLVEHQATGSAAFLGLLLDELHKTPSHADLPARIETLLSANSIDELAAIVLDRIELDLGLERFDDLQAFLGLLTQSPIGYTEAEIVGLISMWRPSFGQEKVAVLRWGVASFLSDVAGTLSIRGAFRRALADRVNREDIAANARSARLTYFSDRERWFTPRAIRELVQIRNSRALEVLREIVTDPRGLVALRSSHGAGHQFVLAAIARHAGMTVDALLQAAVDSLGESPTEVAVDVAHACFDSGEPDLAVEALAASGGFSEKDDLVARNEVLALRGRLALLGKYAFTDDQWETLFNSGTQGQSVNTLIALSGMGASLAQRGDLFWAKKYFDQAVSIGFAAGDVCGLTLAGINSTIVGLEGVKDPLRSVIAPTLRSLFDRAAAIGFGGGDLKLGMNGLIRRSVLDLVHGQAQTAHDGFRDVEDVAGELGIERFMRLARSGRSAALFALGRDGDGVQLAGSLGLSIVDLPGILEAEVLTLLV